MAVCPNVYDLARFRDLRRSLHGSEKNDTVFRRYTLNNFANFSSSKRAFNRLTKEAGADNGQTLIVHCAWQ